MSLLPLSVKVWVLGRATPMSDRTEPARETAPKIRSLSLVLRSRETVGLPSMVVPAFAASAS